ncbi:MAG TPA: VWA domain-containing protein [Bryobacteraceae bacterium]|jgi:Ca-activated chloride channel family protein|nr:VWA domain-containing protein [Bryobacteraceae bacterium]
MKYIKAGLAAAVFIALGVITFHVALAQQGPDSSSSETVARPRKRNPPAEVPADPVNAEPTNTAPAAAPANVPTNEEPATDEPKIPSKFNKKGKDVPENTPTFSSDVNTVELDVAVLDNKGHFLPGIPKNNFRVLEDNVPQKIASFNLNSDAPMTVAMVIEFSNLFQQYYSQGWFQTLTASYGFVETLKPDDYVAVIAYDLRPEILCDFTTDRAKVQDAMQRMRIPGFSEANLFDALVDTEQRMSNIEGRKAILLIASGRDTFSKLTFDKARKAVQEAGVPVYAISMLQAMRIMAEQYMSETQRMDFLQADNEMNTFARESGGQAYFPRFFGEFPSIFQSVSAALRNQYSLTYQPSNQTKDGAFRKVKVELVDPQTGDAMKITEKGKPIKYTVITKAGYTAPRAVE